MGGEYAKFLATESIAGDTVPGRSLLRGLRQPEQQRGQIAGVLSASIRGLTIIGVGDREEVFDRARAIRHPDDAIPPWSLAPCLLSLRLRACRRHARNELRQVVMSSTLSKTMSLSAGLTDCKWIGGGSG